MPYRRNNPRRFKRTFYRRRGYGARRAAPRRRRRRRVRRMRNGVGGRASLARVVKSIMGVEKKFHDVKTEEGAIAIKQDIPSPSLFLIPEGTGSSHKQGQRIDVTEITGKWAFQLEGKTEPLSVDRADDWLHFYLVLDKQPLNGTPVFSDIYHIGTGSNGIQGAVVQRNMASAKRFFILKHKKIRLRYHYRGDNGTNHYISGEVAELDYHLKFKKPLKVTYTTSTGTPTASQVETNNIFIMWRRALTYNTKMQGYTRVRFTDS